MTDSHRRTRVLVTGGAGRLGRFVADELASAHDVLVGDLVENIRHESVHLDVLDLDAVRVAIGRVDAVIHLAALDYDTHAAGEAFIHVNTLGTWNVLQASAEAGIGRVVVCSSVAASGLHEMRNDWRPEVLPVTEEHPLKPVEPYSVSKSVVEVMAQSFVDAGAIEVVALRPCAVVFPENLADFLDSGSEHPPQLFDYVTAEDAAVAFRLALTAPYRGLGRYLLSADDTSHPEPTARWYRRLLGPLPAHADGAYGTDDRTSVFGNGEARRDLGWRPSSDFAHIRAAAEVGTKMKKEDAR